MIEEATCIVSGHVQFVMFRDFARRKARALGLVGEVENLPDGTLRAVAQGPREALEKFVEHLRRGPLLARVEGVAVSWGVPARPFSDFVIRY